MAKLVSKTYGEALFELAKEQNTLDAVQEEAVAILEIFEQNEELVKLLNHPKISKEEKIAVIENIFKGRASDEMVGFLVLIVEKGRYNEICQIFTYFLEQVKEFKRIGVAYVTSATPLTAEQQKKIEEKLLATTQYIQFEMHFDVDKSLIGGMVIRIGDRVVDSSIRTKLNQMTQTLSKVQLQ